MRISICSWLQTSLSKSFRQGEEQVLVSGFGKRQTVMSKAKNRPDMNNLSSFFFILHIFLTLEIVNKQFSQYESLHLLILSSSNQWEQAYMAGLICHVEKKHTTVETFYIINIWVRQNCSWLIFRTWPLVQQQREGGSTHSTRR